MTTLPYFPAEELIEQRAFVRTSWRRRASYVLFLLTTAMLFLRPAEILGLSNRLPFYEICILGSLVLSAPELLQQLSRRSLRTTPIALCVVLLVLASLLSHLSHGFVGQSLRSSAVVARVALYFLLMLAVLDSPEKLARFVRLISWLTLVLAILSLMGYSGVLSTEALQPMAQPYSDAWGDQVIVYRLRGPGIFNDPNDVCLILVPGIMFWIYRLMTARRLRLNALGPLAAIGISLTAILLTKSRGGFIVLLASIVGFMLARLGVRRMLPWICVVMPVLLVLFAGRQTNIDLTDQDDTAQSRIQLWSEGLSMFRSAPLFGVGQGTFADHAQLVAHNSFVHSYAELGFFGGTLFFGAWYLAIRGLRHMDLSQVVDVNFRQLRPSLMGSVAGYVAGMLSLSRSYVVPTYLVLALATVYIRFAPPESALQMRTSPRLVGRVMLASTVCLFVIYVFVRITARWS